MLVFLLLSIDYDVEIFCRVFSSAFDFHKDDPLHKDDSLR